MRVKSVTIEGMHNVTKKTYNFDDGVTYLIGPNGAGKSTVLQAIQLGLLGYIPGTNKRASDIFRHSNNHTMAVTLVLEDGDRDIRIQRIWSKAGSKLTSSVSTIPEDYDIESLVSQVEIPVFNFNEFVNMSANSLKDWFINFLPKTDSDIIWEDEFNKLCEGSQYDASTVIKSLCQNIREADSSVEGLRLANREVKEHISATNAQIKSLQGTLESLIYYEDVDYSDISEFIQKKQELQALKDATLKASAAKEHNARIQSELDKYADVGSDMNKDERYLKVLKAYLSLTEKLESIDKEIQELTECKGKYQAEISTNKRVISSKGVCQYTGEVCAAIQEMISDIEKRTEKLESSLQNHSASLIKCISEKQQLSQKATEASKEMFDIRKRYETKQQLENSILIIDSSVKFADVDMLSSQIAELDDKIAKCRANKQYRDLTDKVTAEKFGLDSKLVILKAFDKLTGPNGLQSSLMSNPFESMESEIDAMLEKLFPEDNIRSHFYVTDKANSFSFGIIRNEEYVAFDLLSSGEKCIYTLALLLAIIKSSTSPLKIVMVDDLLDHLDSDRIVTLFDSLKSVEDVQILLAGVQPSNNIVTTFEVTKETK